MPNLQLVLNGSVDIWMLSFNKVSFNHWISSDLFYQVFYRVDGFQWFLLNQESVTVSSQLTEVSCKLTVQRAVNWLKHILGWVTDGIDIGQTVEGYDFPAAASCWMDPDSDIDYTIWATAWLCGIISFSSHDPLILESAITAYCLGDLERVTAPLRNHLWHYFH